MCPLQSQCTPTIANITATAYLGCTLDLPFIVNKLPNVYMVPGFHAPIAKLENPKCTVLIFKSGRFVVVGTKSTEDSKNAAEIFAASLAALGFPVSLQDYAVKNLVGSYSLGFQVDLLKLRECLGYKCIYEVEMFPGLQYHNDNNITIIVFHTGKLILTGCKSINDMYSAFTTFLPIVSACKK